MADSTTNNDNIFVLYRYTPSFAAAIVFIILFICTTALHGYQILRTRLWYFTPMFIGGCFEWVGYIGRALSSKENPNYTLGPYIMQTLLLLVAPALFAASIYMVLGRIILLADAEHLSPIRRKWLTKAFVTGDVFSFCLQAAGGGIQAGGGNMYKTGENIILAGLVLQIIFFGLFMVVSITFHTRIAKRPTVASQGYHSIWSKQIWVLYAASLLILVRSAFRVVEYGMGNAGYLLRHEVFLYVFDAVLMFLVMVIFNIFHPSVLNVQKSSKQRMMNDGLLLNEVPTTSR